jgi:putative flippase GtrA
MVKQLSVIDGGGELAGELRRPRRVRAFASHSSARYVAVGSLSFAVDESALFVLHGWLGCWLPLATCGAYGAASGVNFGLNRAWAFGARGAVRSQLTRYAILSAVNLGMTVALVSALAATGLQYLLAKAAVAGAIACLNYLACRSWVFRAGTGPGPVSHRSARRHLDPGRQGHLR